MQDLFVVKVQVFGGPADTTMKLDDVPLITKMFMAHNVERYDAFGKPPLLNFWVRDVDGGSTLHQAIVDGGRSDGKDHSDLYMSAVAAYVDTTCGSRVEALRPNFVSETA